MTAGPAIARAGQSRAGGEIEKSPADGKLMAPVVKNNIIRKPTERSYTHVHAGRTSRRVSPHCTYRTDRVL